MLDLRFLRIILCHFSRLPLLTSWTTLGVNKIQVPYQVMFRCSRQEINSELTAILREAYGLRVLVEWEDR